MKRTLLAAALSSLLLGAMPFAPAIAQNVTLKASHQFPGGKGDVRDEMVQMIAQRSRRGQRRPGDQGLPGLQPGQGAGAVEGDADRPDRHDLRSRSTTPRASIRSSAPR